jgi:hypothetical protein
VRRHRSAHLSGILLPDRRASGTDERFSSLNNKIFDRLEGFCSCYVEDNDCSSCSAIIPLIKKGGEFNFIPIQQLLRKIAYIGAIDLNLSCPAVSQS